MSLYTNILFFFSVFIFVHFMVLLFWIRPGRDQTSDSMIKHYDHVSASLGECEKEIQLLQQHLNSELLQNRHRHTR